MRIQRIKEVHCIATPTAIASTTAIATTAAISTAISTATHTSAEAVRSQLTRPHRVASIE
ncbi:MAG: hypothetical protein ACXW1D_07630 [Halobacteriota archaeon]